MPAPYITILTFLTFLTSIVSATALTGLFFGLQTSNLISTSCDSNAPRQRRGRNALIGVSARIFAFIGIIGPCAERLYAVLPAGVERRTPSQASSLSLSLPSTKILIFAVCLGSSNSFLTPIGYQTNMMVYGPGQYRFNDFMKVGLPLSILFWLTATYLITYYWPIKELIFVS